ncbi:uncharacterized protein MONOS_8714 [Monocercomonoides exilis]|uniref:uncharacterized protein n=1 Tax=Monocercomonoides exilis TaxID=2049356 RepID=UPI0035595817|nr:hypothetical protein MONOS_8714 [Monocercomonoides exilis]|eukprot:MONOS_8714.1-p1 / transcript=MONOS_8714.1 / gene=MONOS_8714 / organism=Monocercomonoides_exilis_PA203 / gene_product=unspecified product / transcript_product=unspecified product / location=Mono_scaffold00335:59833-60746(-) / protein_length=89 / sequence_SO=supercontig / SO=protein_coding / is_pseudo=false
MFKLTSCVADALEKEKIIRPNEIVIVEQTQCMSLEEELFGLTQLTTNKFRARSDERAIFHFISLGDVSFPCALSSVFIAIGNRTDKKD